MSPLIRFYAGTGSDDRGRRLDGILAWDDPALERVHDYIQWLFPLPEPSAFNPDAPLLIAADVAAFAEPGLQAALTRSRTRMLHFYRPARRAAWLTPGNHNLLRITRILRCLTLLGQGREAAALHDAILAMPGAADDAGGVTLRYWRAALGGTAG